MSSITELTFSASPGGGATLGATAHLVPQVSLGLKALDGIASASVFLNFDGSLGLQGNVTSGTNPQPCLTGNAEINVEVGAQGSFFGLFDDSVGQSLFDKNFTLFQVRAPAHCILTFVRIFIILFAQQQKCFDGNSNSSNSTTQSSVPASTSTVPASQSSATDSTTTSPASQSGTIEVTTTNPASQSGTIEVTSTDSVHQTGITDVSKTDSASKTGATDAIATSNAKLRHGAPRAVRHSARFGRSYLALFAN